MFFFTSVVFTKIGPWAVFGHMSEYAIKEILSE